MNALQSSWSAIIKLCVMLTHASSNFIMTVFSKMLCVYILKTTHACFFNKKCSALNRAFIFLFLFFNEKFPHFIFSLPKNPVAYHTGSGHRAFWLGVRPKTAVVSCNLNMNSRVLMSFCSSAQHRWHELRFSLKLLKLNGVPDVSLCAREV